MIQELEDLMQRALDGGASAEERRLLEARLADDPVARRRYDELASVFQCLGNARLADAPSGLGDAILEEIRKSPLPGRPGVPEVARGSDSGHRTAFPWWRVAFPSVAAVLAVALLWMGWSGRPSDRSPAQVSGTMSAGGAAESVRVGSGAAAVLVRGVVAEGGFVLSGRTGNLPVTYECESATEGVRMALTAAAREQGGGRVVGQAPARSAWAVYGSVAGPEATLHIRVRYPDGATATNELRLRGLTPVRTRESAQGEPTSRPPPGP